MAVFVFAEWSRRTATGKENTAESGVPNIVLILADDLGYGECGMQGNADVPTPHIDRLAASGVRCTSGYVTASYCSPSRAGLLTGRYQTRFGHEMNPVGQANLDPKAGLPRSERTLADLLKQAGYRTGLVGKWHLGGAAQAHPNARGFDEFYGFLHEGHFFVPPPYDGVTSFLRKKQLKSEQGNRLTVGNVTYSSHMGSDEPPYDDHNPLFRNATQIGEPEYLTDAFSREAVNFIERHREQPFFLYLAYNAVHSPMQASEAAMQKFSHIEDLHRRVFAAMLSQLDDGVGQVMEALRANKLEEQTLVFFISDNGGPTKELTSGNRPLRGGKGDLYEGGVRVPFTMSWPGNIPAGKTYDRPVISTDVFATALASANVPMPTDRTYDSVNLIPYVRGQQQAPPHQTIYWRMGNKAALRRGDFKLVRQPPRGQNEAPWELYDLKNDLAESQNLANEQPERLRQLVGDWEKLNEEMVPPIWTRP